MKSRSAAAAFVLTVLLVGGTAIDARADGAMKGIDPTYRGGATGVSHGGTGGGGGGGSTCSVAIRRCKTNFPASAAACGSAGASCMQTGTFTNPQGKSFPGLARM
jgi:hypothetical protein